MIIGTGSTVTKDVPDNSVVAGSPAKVIGSFENYAENRRIEDKYSKELTPKNQKVSAELVAWCWEQFKKREK